MGFLVASSKLVMFTAILMVVTISVAVLPLVSSSASSSSSSSSSSTVTYKVGDDDDDDAGWSTEPPLMGDSVSNSYNGNGWISSSSSKAFHVGDTILFEYDPHKYQTVVQVTPTAYDLCDYTSPLAIFTTGNDSITFNNTGHYYFIFGPGGGCVQGQMLHIYVHEPEEEDDDDDNVSAVPTLAPAAVSSPSPSLAAAVAAASTLPTTPSSDDDNDFDGYPLYIIMMMMIFAFMYAANT